MLEITSSVLVAGIVLAPLIVAGLLVAILSRLRQLTFKVYVEDEDFVEAVSRQSEPLVIRGPARSIWRSGKYEYVTDFKGQTVACRTDRELEFPAGVDELTVAKWR